MDNLLGLLRVHVERGTNLPVRDVRTSDPYVVLRMGRQKLKTRVIKKNINPEWNEDLTLSVRDPTLPVKLEVYDKDTFTLDDPMGDAEFNIQPFVDVMSRSFEGLTDNTIIYRLQPNRENCLAEESHIKYIDGKVVQDIWLRLRNVECGEVKVQLEWINVPRSSVL